jgi:hypothetical protein
MHIKIKGRNYKIPYIEEDNFNFFITKKALDIHSLNYEELYEFFKFVFISFKQVVGEMEEKDSINHSKEYITLVEQMDEVDKIQKDYYLNNGEDKSKEVMIDYIEKLLRFYNRMIEYEKESVLEGVVYY